MENQHREISGYRELSKDEIASMNAIKEVEIKLNDLLDHIRKIPALNGRSMALAQTKFDEGFMWAVRAIARPNGE